jgi:DNA-binding MarR family transcriptional regulator
VLERAGEVSQGQLGEMLAMDSTSLTRTLAIMGREGWIRERKGKDRRERYLRLSSAGKTQLKNVLPAWEKVQSRLRRQVGSEAWSGMMQLTNQITKVVATKGDSL